MNHCKRLHIIVAVCKDTAGIGYQNELPWGRQLSDDLKRFRTLTIGQPAYPKDARINCCIMGRKTYESIPKRYRPLKQRFNIVLSRNPQFRASLCDIKHAMGVPSFEAALAYAEQQQKENRIRDIFVIGGVSVYRAALALSYWQKCIYLTWVGPPDFHSDVFLPELLKLKKLTATRDVQTYTNGIHLRYVDIISTE